MTQARARLAQAQAQLRTAGTRPEQIAAQRSRALAAEAETQRAAAALQQAQLNLQYTTIVAPVSGVVGQRSVQPGQNVSPGQRLMTVVPLDSRNIWVTANFKETQLQHLRPGQPATISLTPTGARQGAVFNTPEPADARYACSARKCDGNDVKVVQRIPGQDRVRPGAGH